MEKKTFWGDNLTEVFRSYFELDKENERWDINEVTRNFNFRKMRVQWKLLAVKTK